jgi:CheY-like chemotaxis protein
MASASDIHVLVVDDSQQMRFLVRCLLRAGCITDVSEAATAIDAFTIMRARAVDLIIVDWMMHPMDGLDFTRLVRSDPESPKASRVAAARDAGVTGFIKKPISTRLLFERVASALTDTRVFIRSEDFFGPDRRHGQLPHYAGPFRRSSDVGADTVDLDDVRWRA